MELKVLKKKMSKLKDIPSKEECDERMLKLASSHTDELDLLPNPWGNRQLILAIEELSELQKEITKYIRKGGQVTDKTSLLEELGDVQNVLVNLQYIFRLREEDILRSRVVKMDRFEESFKNGIIYK